MAERPWQPTVRHVVPGEAVRAGVDGRPTRDLEARTAYLKDRMDAAELGRAVFDRDAALAPGLVAGCPVYWDDGAQRYAAAYAGWAVDAAGVVAPAPAALVVGLLYAKTSDTLGAVVLSGRVDALDLTAVVVGGEVRAGPLWLSGDPGLLTWSPVPTGPLVAVADGAGGVFVTPSFKGFVEDHTHYRHELVCRPAGTHVAPAPGDRHAIADADADRPGWLPADHPVFGGRAPSVAAWGYNLRADPALRRLWPPVPLAAAGLVWDKGAGGGGVEVPLGVTGLCVVDRNGLWWTSDCYGDVPWPTDLDTAVSSSASSSARPECPRDEQMRLAVYFTRMAFLTDRTVVTSLAPAAGSPIRVLDCDGAAASTGALVLALDGEFALEGTTEPGHLVVKSQSGSKFLRGPVVEALRADPDGSVELTATATRAAADDAAVTEYLGTVTVKANLEPGERLLLTQVVDLADVRQRTYLDLMALGFPAGQAATARVKLAVPTANLPASPRLKIRVQVWGRTAGTLPDLTFAYRVVPRPAGLTPAAVPTADTAGTLACSAAVGADEYVEAETDDFAVAAGDTVQFTVGREAADGYAGEVLLLDVTGVLFGG